MEIGAIDPRGGNLDQNLARAWHGIGNISKLKPVLGTGIFQDNGLHKKLARIAARAHTSG
jgi:hypothetical protein